MSRKPKIFMPGTVVQTAAVERDVPLEYVTKLLDRHMAGDWGDVCEEDAKLNEEALEYGNRLLSSYETSEHGKLWIITEADRSVTTVLFPHEY